MITSDLESPANVFLTANQVAERYGVRRSTIERWVRDGVFPQPMRINGTTPRWRLLALFQWEAEQGGE